MTGELGGYLKWEFTKFWSLDKLGIPLNSGRNALEYIIHTRGIRTILLPYFICDSIVSKCLELAVQIEYYHMNNKFFPLVPIEHNSDAIFIVNYFGVNDESCAKAISLYDKVILDNSQAFFSTLRSDFGTIYSPRKFFGVPDGGIVYCNKVLKNNLETDISGDRIRHLITRLELSAKEGYNHYLENERLIGTLALKRMSPLSLSILESVNISIVRSKRKRHFTFLHNALGHMNHHFYFDTSPAALIYPYFSVNAEVIRKRLLAETIYVPIYWPCVKQRVLDTSTLEYLWTNNIVALPVDQNADLGLLKRVVEIINLVENGSNTTATEII